MEQQQQAGKIETTLSSYNTTLINLIWKHKIKLSIFIIITFLGHLSIPRLIELQERLEKKEKHGYQMLDLKRLEERKEIFDIIIDVRSKEEYEKGHVKNSINVDYKDILNQKDILRKHKIKKDKVILICCNSGKRASIVVDHLVEKHGFDSDNLFLIIENYKKINHIL